MICIYTLLKNVFRCVLLMLLASVLLSHGLQAQADPVHPNTQISPIPSYSKDSDKEFSLPPITDAPTLTQDPQKDSTMKLDRVEFSGNTVFTDAKLQKIVKDFIDKPIDANDLTQLILKINKQFSDEGYVNSGASLSKLNLLDGVLTVKIIEGRLTDINISDNVWLHPDKIGSRLQFNEFGINALIHPDYIRRRLLRHTDYIQGRLLSDPPLDELLDVNVLKERYMMLLDDPLIDRLNGSLKPTGVLGEAQLDIKVTQARPYGMSVQGNNYRAPSIGSEQFIVNGWVRNLTRWGDVINFSYGLSKGSNIYSGGIALPLNSAGTIFSFNFNLGNNAVIEEPLNSVDIRSKVENFSWSLSHPLYKSLNHTAILGTSFATRYNQTSLLGQDFSFVEGLTTGKSRVSVVRVFQEYLGRFDRQVIALRSTFNVGINAFNATIQSSNSLPDSQYLSWLGQSQYVFKVLDNGAQFKARSNIQLTNDSLLAQERMSVGGVRTVRGYRENELVRDQGYTGSIEFHYPIIGQVGGIGNKVILIPFMDYGAAWNKGKSARRLHSVGIGFHWQPIKYIKADFFYGYDIKKADNKTEYNLQDSGIHFNLTLSSF
ncbi:MAG: hypothetical protein K0U40_09955 [Betaproteobacteria bacterium]|nr:hypothetical protein [Betaproteobacteria bacterium]